MVHRRRMELRPMVHRRRTELRPMVYRHRMELCPMALHPHRPNSAADAAERSLYH
jgi:hypothetical protein